MDDDCVILDQRGYARRQASLSDATQRRDIGAVEAPTAVMVETAQDDDTLFDGTNSFRDAIALAQAGGRILFDPGLDGAVIDLSTAAGGENAALLIQKDLVIDATSLSNGVTIAGPSSGRPIHVSADDIQVAMHGVSATRGNVAGNGGGFRVADCQFTLTHAAVYGNHASADGGGFLINNATCLFENVTISDNDAGDQGGGIFAWADSKVVLRHATVGNNISVHGGAGFHFSDSVLGLLSSVIANNRESNGVLANASLSGASSLDSQGYNLTDGNFLTNASDAISANAMLAPLMDAGGLARTQPPLTGSPIVDGAVRRYGLPTTDGRGLARVYGSAPDAGAFELGPMSKDDDADLMDDFWETYFGFDPADPADAADNEDGDGDNNVTEYINETNPGTNSVPSPELKIVAFQLDFTGNETMLTFPSLPGHMYEARYRRAIDGGTWIAVGDQAGFAGYVRTSITLPGSSWPSTNTTGFFQLQRD